MNFAVLLFFIVFIGDDSGPYWNGVLKSAALLLGDICMANKASEHLLPGYDRRDGDW